MIATTDLLQILHLLLQIDFDFFKFWMQKLNGLNCISVLEGRVELTMTSQISLLVANTTVDNKHVITRAQQLLKWATV